MKKEYRGKFGNFVHEERKKEEETLEICEDILKNRFGGSFQKLLNN